MRITLCILLACVFLHGQTTPHPQFEVASIKPAELGRVSPRGPGGPGTPDPSRIYYTDKSLKDLIFSAYAPMPYQVDVPTWMEQGERFDIIATIPPGSVKSDVPSMLQALLVERFHLKLKHEIKDMPAYSLSLGKTGMKMKEYDAVLPDNIIEALKMSGLDSDGVPTVPPGYSTAMMYSANGQTFIAMARQPMERLCRFLSSALEYPVVDQTNLKGRYDVRLHFASEHTLPGGAGAKGETSMTPNASDPSPTVIQAVQNQLGLRLELRKLPIDVLVVESAERQPTEN
jgi:uncharacterized protein (TIGR03435 family)